MRGFQRSISGSLVPGACLGAPALAQPVHPAVRPVDGHSTSNLHQVALGDMAMRLDGPRIATEPLRLAAPGRPGRRAQAANASGDETTHPRAGAVVLKGSKP